MPTANTQELGLALAAGVGLGVACVYGYKILTSPPKIKIVEHADRDLAPTPAEKKSSRESHWNPVRAARGSKELMGNSPLLPPSEPLPPAALQRSPSLPPALMRTETSAESSSNLAAHHISTWQDPDDAHPVWPRPKTQRKQGVINPMALKRPHMNFLNPDEKVLGSIILNDSKAALRSHALDGGAIRGNATKDIWHEPTRCKAALVTCGGLCPGLNSIIQGVTNCLWRDYGVRDIVGITAGYNGLTDPAKHPSIALTPEVVETIHLRGGSMLKAGRGGFDAGKCCETLRAGGYTHLFVIGGDGTQFAGHLLYEEARKQNLPISVVGVPKSIDNDVLFVDRTFGFDSAVEAAAGVIRNGWIEATSCAKGVGIIKLMGRDAGFVAAHAALASNLVDLVLVPEVTVSMEDILAHVDRVIEYKEHCVIVVAEGAGQEHVATGKKDATGHPIYGDIGIFLRDTLNAYLKPKGGRTFYIDPSYIIRSVCPTPTDHIYCTRLSNNAVHTAMRGYTGVCVGAIHNIVVILKSKLIASGKKQLKIKSSTWQTCVQVCAMPDNLTGMSAPPQKGY